jgi:hypothetical protein
MLPATQNAAELHHQWRRRLTSHCNPRFVAARKGFVAMTFVDQGKTGSRFVDIPNLLVVVLYEDESLSDCHPALRFAAYSVSCNKHGIRWGGSSNCRLFKNLALVPQPSARGQRLDRRKTDLVALALRLDRRLSRAARHSAAPWPPLRLPTLWAGFPARHAAGLSGAQHGSDAQSRAAESTSPEFFRVTHNIDGLTAFPIECVSHQLDRAVAVFAELTLATRRQVCRIGSVPDGLIGIRGPSEFDFYKSQFRRRWRQATRTGNTSNPRQQDHDAQHVGNVARVVA